MNQVFKSIPTYGKLSTMIASIQKFPTLIVAKKGTEKRILSLGKKYGLALKHNPRVEEQPEEIEFITVTGRRIPNGERFERSHSIPRQVV